MRPLVHDADLVGHRAKLRCWSWVTRIAVVSAGLMISGPHYDRRSRSSTSRVGRARRAAAGWPWVQVRVQARRAAAGRPTSRGGICGSLGSGRPARGARPPERRRARRRCPCVAQWPKPMLSATEGERGMVPGTPCRCAGARAAGAGAAYSPPSPSRADLGRRHRSESGDRPQHRGLAAAGGPSRQPMRALLELQGELADHEVAAEGDIDAGKVEVGHRGRRRGVRRRIIAPRCSECDQL